MTFLYGMLGALCLIAVFVGGAFAGWYVRGQLEKAKTPEKAELEKLGEREREQLMADQQAFRKMMNFNIDNVYSEIDDEELGAQ